MSKQEQNEEQENTEPVVEVVEEPTSAEGCEKCDEATNGWKRALADYDNLKKDLMRERDTIRKAAKENVAEELITVLDNFDQAAKFQPKELDKEAQTWAVGLMHVRNQLESVMQGLGLAPYGAPGETFDTNLHDAASERSEEGKADQEILDIVMRGWKMGEKIVRPAKVIVNNK
jgi:molecular chaperone GrpE